MPNLHDAETVELAAPLAAKSSLLARTLSALIDVDMAGLSHPGKVRPNNEDHFLITRFGRFLEIVQTNVPIGELPAHSEEIGYGMLVADGIGGNAAGEVASKLAISTIVSLVLATPDWILTMKDDTYSAEVMRRAKERCEQINEVLTEQAEADPTLRGFGTTLTMAVSVGKDLFLTNIGDSRAYLLRHSGLHQLTRDHTIAQRLADCGIIAQHAVATHHLRNVLTRSLGCKIQGVQPDVRQFALEDGDCLLLCSDGLTDMVDKKRIEETLAAGEPAAKSCHILVDQALQAGGKDNVTVIVARYRFPAPS